MVHLKQSILIAVVFVIAIGVGPAASAIDIVLDYSLDDSNEGWFSGSPEGLARRSTRLLVFCRRSSLTMTGIA
jgi:hypothetical protein